MIGIVVDKLKVVSLVEQIKDGVGHEVVGTDQKVGMAIQLLEHLEVGVKVWLMELVEVGVVVQLNDVGLGVIQLMG